MTINDLINTLSAPGVNRDLDIAINVSCDESNWYEIQNVSFDDEVCIFNCDM